MAELPSGTVTFLFTDVEGSTRLLKQLRDRYGEVLRDHRRILRAAFAEHGGQEIDTQGDAFFVAFRKATDAALAAGAAQRALAEHTWPDEAECRVRMGLHTGEPSVGEEGYHGLGVHRAARIMAAGHGGQILLSQATCSVLEDDELPGIRVRDLGEHHLKDIDRPEHIHQLDVEGLPVEFPPLRTADAPTAYTGREDELAKTAQALVWRARLRTRRWVGTAIAAPLIAGGLIVAFVGIFDSSSAAHALSQVDSNAVGLIDAKTGDIASEVQVGATPSHVAVGEGFSWVTNEDDNTVSQIDLGKREVVQRIGVGSQPSGIAVGNGAVWVANSLDGTIWRIDPRTSQVVQRIPVDNGPVDIVYAAGSIWVANTGDETITRIDAGSGKPGSPLPIAATALAFGAGTLWASQRTANRVARIDPTTERIVATIPVGNGPSGIAFGGGAAWVANTPDGTVSRMDPETNSVRAVIPTGNGPTAVAVGANGVWASNQFGGTLTRIDPQTNRVVRRISVGNRPSGMAISGGRVLVSVRQSGAGHRGGTLTVRMNRGPDSIDPGVAYDTTSLTILGLTTDGLAGFNHASGLAGAQLVPDLAVSLSAPTDGGRTYTFRLRPNIRYSNGRPVRASDFRATAERNFKLGKSGAGAAQYYNGIVGAARCEQRPKRCDLSHGIVVDDGARTVTVHLVGPDSEFLYKFPVDSVVPAGTPPREATQPLPTTGPYVIASYHAKRILTLRRNPHFHEWSKAAQPDGYPDEIVFKIGGTPDGAVDDVIRGDADVFSSAQSQNPPSEGRLAALKLRYASQVHTTPQPATVALFLNTRIAPFDRLDVRRALNYAADRAAAIRIAGGPDVAQPTCQILPPQLPGYRAYCPYTAGSTTTGSWTAPDLAKARALVARSGTRGMKVTFWSWPPLRRVGPYAVKLLRSLGYRASLRIDTNFAAFDSRSKAQIGTIEWIADYPTASGFFNPSLSCASFVPETSENVNAAEFCDPRLDGQIRQGQAEQATNPDAARGLWERIDRRTVDQAPWVPLVNPKVVDVLSKRVGNYQYTPAGGMLIDQLWVR